jgi:hypothetical protein
VPGASGAWATGADATAQTYVYTEQSFGGALPDLASQVTINVLLRHHGAKLRGSVPFAACPAAAGVATFALPNRTLLQEAFAVHNAQAVRITYVRPLGAPVDPAVTDAMQKALCVL